jgi:hypothetical protein
MESDDAIFAVVAGDTSVSQDPVCEIVSIDSRLSQASIVANQQSNEKASGAKNQVQMVKTHP